MSGTHFCYGIILINDIKTQIILKITKFENIKKTVSSF